VTAPKKKGVLAPRKRWSGRCPLPLDEDEGRWWKHFAAVVDPDIVGEEDSMLVAIVARESAALERGEMEGDTSRLNALTRQLADLGLSPGGRKRLVVRGAPERAAGESAYERFD